MSCFVLPFPLQAQKKKKKVPTWQAAMFSNTTFKANPKTSGQAQYHCAMMRYIYIYMCVCVCVYIYIWVGVYNIHYIMIVFIIRSETLPIIPN